MSWRWLFFSFRGRINRSQYWLAMLAYGLLGVALWLGKWALSRFGISDFGPPILLHTVNAAYDIAFSLSCLAVSAKRLHDRDKSGWWLVMLYAAPFAAVLLTWLVSITNVALAGLVGRLCILAAFAFVVWLFVELGCLPGSHGYNRYGRDPLAAA